MPRKKPQPDPFQEKYDLAAKHVLIDVHWQNEGGVYALNHRSKRRLLERFPDALVNPVLMVGYDGSRDFNRYHRPYWEQLARILTGLTPEQMSELGGIVIYDVDHFRVVWEWGASVISPRDAATASMR